MENENIYSEQKDQRNYKTAVLIAVFSVLPVLTFFIGFQWGSSRQLISSSEESQIVPSNQPTVSQSTSQEALDSQTQFLPEPEAAQRLVLEGKNISFAEIESLLYLRDQGGSYDFFVFRTEESKNKFTACMNDGVYGGVDYSQYGECNLYDVGVRIIIDSIQSGETIEAFIDRTRSNNFSQDPPRQTKIGMFDAYYYEEVGMGIIRKYIIQNDDTIYIISGNFFDSQVGATFEEVVQTVSFL